MGTPVVLTGMKATTNLQDVAYVHVCMCAIMLCGVWDCI